MITQLYLTNIAFRETILVGVQNRDAHDGQLYVLQHFSSYRDQVVTSHLATFDGQMPKSSDGRYILLDFQGKVIDATDRKQEHVPAT